MSQWYFKKTPIITSPDSSSDTFLLYFSSNKSLLMSFQLAKDMERWAKAQNKKKEEIKRVAEEVAAPATVAKIETKRDSSTGNDLVVGSVIVC